MATQLTLATLLVKLQADVDDYNRKMKRSGKEADIFAKNIEGAGKKVTAFAAGAMVTASAAVAEFTRQSIAEFNTFEAGMAEVFTLMPGKSQAAYDAMSDDVRAFSVEVGRQTDEVIPALYQAISAGVPPDNVFEFMQVASDAAMGGVTDLETAVDGITSVVNAYGDEIIGAAEASDVMFTAVRMGKTNFEELSNALFNVIPAAASLGVSFNDVAADLAALTAQGTPTSVATTQLRQAFVEASKEGSVLSAAIQELTGKSFTQLIAGGKTSSEIFGMLRDSMPEEDFRNLFSSVEAMNAALGLTTPTAESVIGSFGTMEDNMGSTAAAAETMSETGVRAMEEFSAAVEGLKLAIGEELSGETASTVRGLTAFVKVITENVDDIAKFSRAVALLMPETRAQAQAMDALDKALRLQGAREAMTAQNDLRAAVTGAGRALDAEGNILQVSTDLANQNADAIHAAAMARAEAAGANDELNDKVAQSNAHMTEAEAAAMQAVEAARAWRDAQREAAEATRQANIELFNFTNTAVQGAMSPIAELTAAQADLVAAQGEWVEGTQDNSVQIAGIHQQLATDLTDEQKRAMQDVLASTEEGGAEWLAAWNALQGDMTAAQRSELVAQLADLQGTHGEMRTVFTGDASAAEEAQERITAAYQEISRGYKAAALEIFQAKIGELIATDGLAAAQGLIMMQEAMGLITPEEAAILDEVATKTARIEETVGSMTEKFLADGQLTREEAEQIAAAVNLIEDSSIESSSAIQSLAESGVGSIDELNESTIAAGERFTEAREQANLFRSDIEMLNGQTVNVDVVTNYSYTGEPPPGSPSTPGGAHAYQHGGYTGDGPANMYAGSVHRGEYVFSAPAVRNVGGPEFLEELHEMARQGPMSIMNSGNRSSSTVNNIYASPGMNPDQLAMEMERRQAAKERLARASGSWRSGG